MWANKMQTNTVQLQKHTLVISLHCKNNNTPTQTPDMYEHMHKWCKGQMGQYIVSRGGS